MRVMPICLLFLALCGTTVAMAEDTFPPFSRPTMVGGDSFGSGIGFVRGDRVDFAFGAADQLQAAGFARDAMRIRGVFAQSRSPMQEEIYLSRQVERRIDRDLPKSTK
jgi:hypothetical protein